MKIKVARKNKNLRSFNSNLETMRRKRVFVGIPKSENARPGDPVGNSEIGFINEFGSPAQSIPARPFLNPGAKEAMEKGGLKILKESAKNAISDPAATESGLKMLGTLAQSSVKNRIIKQIGFKKPAKSTLAARERKNFAGTKALIVTGSLVNSIRWVVTDGAS